jgi:hypothetical protein
VSSGASERDKRIVDGSDSAVWNSRPIFYYYKKRILSVRVNVVEHFLGLWNVLVVKFLMDCIFIFGERFIKRAK